MQDLATQHFWLEPCWLRPLRTITGTEHVYCRPICDLEEFKQRLVNTWVDVKQSVIDKNIKQWIRSLPISNRQYKSLNYVLHSSFRKIFKTKSQDIIINKCMLMFNCPSAEEAIQKRRNFVNKYINTRVRTIVWKSDSPIIDSIGQNNWPMW